MEDTTYRRRVALMEAQIDDEIVGLDRQAGHCFGFNPVATDVWKMLAEPKRASELCDRLVADYAVSREECEQDIARLLEQMAAMGLVEPAGKDA